MSVGLWMVGLARTAAAQDPNLEPMVVLGLLHQGGAEHPWGVELGTEWLVALGDHCGYRETDGCRGSGWWPIGGPRATVTWRGGTRIGGALEVVAGVAALDMYMFGFFPMASLKGAGGVVLEVGRPAAASFGGTATKSLSYRVYGGSGYTEHGLPMLSAGFAVRGSYDGELRPARWAAGLEMATMAGQYD
jgi:hypothetical protein